jgi:nucleotide-binding universal stress UspA family protein
MFSTIMVPTDGSEYAALAEDMAIKLALKLGSRVVAVHVIDEKLIYPYEILEDEGKSILENVRKKGENVGLQVDEILIMGSPTHDLAKIAEKANADLVIIASHGRSGLTKLLIGSVAENVLKVVNVPILLVK